MGLKQHDIIKCKCRKIYVSHTNLITSSSCVNETKHDCKTVKNKSQLKVKDDEQNPEKNTGKGIQVPPPLPSSFLKKILANHRHRPEKCTKNYKTRHI